MSLEQTSAAIGIVTVLMGCLAGRLLDLDHRKRSLAPAGAAIAATLVLAILYGFVLARLLT